MIGDIIMKIKCCICGKLINKKESNNPAGAMCKDNEGNVVELTFNETDRCCDDCNVNFVIPGRLYKFN